MDFIPITDNDKAAMLDSLGLKSIGELFDLSIPDEVRLKRPLDLPQGVSEYELIKELQGIAADNYSLDSYISFLGGGAYDHFVPQIVDAIISLPEFYTPYTPYQPEVSQGILQALFEYQTMISELTGFEIANDSLYDGSTTVAEAALLAHDVTKKTEVIISEAVHPEYRDVLKNYTRGIGITIKTVPMKNGSTDIAALEDMISDETACVIMQQPNFFGCLEDMPRVGDITDRYPVLFIASVDPISLGILQPPAEYGADVAIGEGQPLGNKLNFGGPYLGIFACRKEYLRRVPGHLTSATIDTEGRTGYVFTLQTREQHIKRERATSNICTSEILNAIAAAVYLSYIGPAGLKEVATQCIQKAHYMYDRLRSISYLEPLFDAPFFKEFAFKSTKPVAEINSHLIIEGIIGGLNIGRLYPEYENAILFCVTEKRTKQEIDILIEILESI
ncbi:aminomethyl-transferring glycine dehydrogenase subunit GcvPA [Candidatus Aquicultor secundus]|uniref:aminomethyl-transferring glycine dehydrogenase subunit GcvPA n=1 Tax=Candidatus Aquicultor secundus TaxID=1973895 RepID=UPI000A99AE3F|nr:aminomethyl-transferring glycine dehydrogenase subunit GcvPA [Candidatus Aquicultor secundus]